MTYKPSLLAPARAESYVEPPRDVRRALAEAVALRWNVQGIRYGVAHGLEGYPHGSLGRDLDVVIERRDLDCALRILVSVSRQARWEPVVIHRKPWAWWIIILDGAERVHPALEIDLIPEIQWGPVTLVSAPTISTHVGPFNVDPWPSFVKRVLIQLLGGNVKRLQERPREFILSESEAEVVVCKLRRYFGVELSSQLSKALRPPVDPFRIQALIPLLRRQLVMRAIRQNPLRLALPVFSWARNEFSQQIGKPCAPIAALVGPDGVGKSRTVENLHSAVQRDLPFAEVAVRHWRPSFLPSLFSLLHGRSEARPFLGPPRREPGRYHAIRLGYYLLDFVLGYWFKDRQSASGLGAIFYDRCALDMAVDPVRYGLRSSRGTLLLWRLIPKPKPVVLLYDTPERILARKAELERHEVERQLKTWVKLAEQGHVNAVIRVDAEPEEIARRIQDLLVDEFIRMNGGDLCTRLRDEEAVSTLRAIVSGKPFSTFAVVPSQRRPRFLIPLAPRRAAAASLKVYNPQKPLARLAKHLLRIGLRTGLAQHLLSTHPTFSAPDPLPPDGPKGRSLQEHLGDVLGEKNLTMAASLGNPGPDRKPVLQLMNSHGQILGYAKVGWNEQTIELVRREEAVLNGLRDLRFSTATIPRVLHAGWWDGRYILVEDAPEGPTKLSGQELSHRHLEFLRELRTVNPKQSRPVEDGPANELAQRIATLRARGLHYYPHLLEQAVARCVERLVDVPISFGLKHGDFTPWNILDESGKLFIFDWEYADESALPGWDLFHFIVYTSVLVKGLDGRRCLQDVRRQSTPPGGLAEFLAPAGATQQLLGPLFFLYVADIMSWHLLRHAEAWDEKDRKMRDAWTYLLTMAAFADSAF